MLTRNTLIMRWLLPIIAVVLLIFVWAKRTGPVYMLADYETKIEALDGMSKVILRCFPEQPLIRPVIFNDAPNYPFLREAKDAECYWLRDRAKYGERAIYAYLACRISIPRFERGSQFADFNAGYGQRKKDYISFMKRGEKLDPDNALYPLLLASLYWRCSMKAVTHPYIDRSYSSELLEPGKLNYENLPEVKVTNETYFQSAVAEYRNAMQKKLCLYISERNQANIRRVPIDPNPMVTEQYLKLQGTFWFDDIELENVVKAVRKAKLAALWLAQHDQLKTALTLIQPNHFTTMLTEDHDTATATAQIASYQGSDMAALTQYLLKQAHRPVEAKQYGHMSRELKAELSKFKQDIPPYFFEYGTPWLSNVHAVQIGWTAAGYVCALMWIACCSAQVFWYIVRLGKPKSIINTNDFTVPERLVNISLAAASVLTVVLFLVQRKAGEDAVSLIFLATVIPAAIISVVMRYRYKQYCLQAGIKVPSRAAEILCNWIVVLLAAVLMMIIQHYRKRFLYGGIPIEVWITMVAPFVALTIPLTIVKSMSSEYYAKAAQTWMRYLGVIVVWISLVGLPVMTVGEVILLKNDQIHLGALKSPAKLMKHMNMMYLQLSDHVQQITNKADAKGGR